MISLRFLLCALFIFCMNIQALDPESTDRNLNNIAPYLAAHKKILNYQHNHLASIPKKIIFAWLTTAQHKATDLAKDISNMHDSIRQLIYLIAQYRDYQLLTIDADNDDDDIMNFIIYWRKDKEERKKEKAEKKEAKREAKEAKREAKREAKETRSNTSSGSQQSTSNTTSNNSNSKQNESLSSGTNQSRQPQENKSSQSTSSQQKSSHTASETSKSHSTPASNTSSSSSQSHQSTPHKDNPTSAHENDTQTALLLNQDQIALVQAGQGNAELASTLFGGLTYNPDDDTASNIHADSDKKDDTPEPSPAPQHQNDALKKQNEFVNERKASIENTRQRCLAQDPVNKKRAIDAQYMRREITAQQAYDACKEVDDAVAAEKARREAAAQAKADKKAADNAQAAQKKQNKANKKAQEKAQLAQDRSFGERCADFFLGRTKRKKPQQPEDTLEQNQTSDQQTPPAPENNETKHEEPTDQILPESPEPTLDDVAPSDPSDEQQPESDQDPVDQQLPQKSQETFSHQPPEKPPVQQSYFDYFSSWFPQFPSGDDNNDGSDDKNEKSDREETNADRHVAHQKKMRQNAEKKCKMPAQAAQELRDNIGKNVDPENKAKLNSMIDSMVNANNDTTIELAQAGLQAWDNAQNAETVEEYDRQMQQYNNISNSLKTKLPTQSIAEQAAAVKKSQIDALLNEYTKKTIDVSESKADRDRLEKRKNALMSSQEQLASNNLAYKDYDVSPQARGFMMANNMNYAAFDGMIATDYQHCLLEENLKVVEFSANMARYTGQQPIIKEFSKNLCNLAISAQQLNQLSKIEQATAMTDINNIFYCAAQAIVGTAVDTGIGVLQGTTRSIESWLKFGNDLCTDPQQTIGKIAKDLKATGSALADLGVELNEFSLFAYYDDMKEDLLYLIHQGKNFSSSDSEKSRTQTRLEANQKTVRTVVDKAKHAISNIMETSLKDNISNITEFSVNSLISGKIIQGIGNLSTLVGNELIQAAQDIKDAIPSQLFNKPIQLMTTSTGEIIAVVQGTGENVLAAVATKGKNLGNSFTKNTAGSAAGKAIKNATSTGGKPPVKPQHGTVEWKKQHPHGEYIPDGKHHENAKGNVSKPPRDGQSALNNSFTVERSDQRVAIQDGKVVILKHEGNGIYHAYIHEDIKTLQQNIKDSLVENGFMKNAVAKKLIKK